MKNILPKLSLFLPVILAFRCGENEPPTSLDSVNFMLVNSSYESLIADKVGTGNCPAARYHTDSLKAFDQSGREVPVTLYTLATDPCSSIVTLGLGRAGIMNKGDFEVTYFLHLNAVDVDTILIVGRGQLPDQMYLNGVSAGQPPSSVPTQASFYLIK